MSLQAKRGVGGPIRLHGSPLTAPRNRLKPYVLKPPSMKDLSRGSRKLGVPDFYPVPANAPEERIDKTTVGSGHWETFGIEANDEYETFKKVFTLIQEKDFRDKVTKLREMALRSKSQALALPLPKATVQFPTQVMQADDSLRKKWISELSYPARQDDLQPGTPSFTPLRELASTVPHGFKGQTLLDMLVENQVPILRATWYVKVIYLNQYHPSRANSAEQRSTQWTQTLVKYLEALIPASLRASAPALPAASAAAAAPASQKQRPAPATAAAAAAAAGEPSSIAIDRASFLKWAYGTRLLLWHSAKGLLDPKVLYPWYLSLLSAAAACASPADEEHLGHYAFPLLPHLLPDLCRSHAPFRSLLEWLLPRARRLVAAPARGAAPAPSPARVASVVRLCLRYVAAAVPDAPRWPEAAELRSLLARVEAACPPPRSRCPRRPPPPPAPPTPRTPRSSGASSASASDPPPPSPSTPPAPPPSSSRRSTSSPRTGTWSESLRRSGGAGAVGVPPGAGPSQCLLDTICRWALALPATAPGPALALPAAAPGPYCATDAHPLRTALAASIARRHADAMCAAAIETAPPGAAPESQAEYAVVRLQRGLVDTLLRLAPLAASGAARERIVGLFGELARRGLFSRERHRRELVLRGALEPPAPPEGTDGYFQLRLLEEIPSLRDDGSPDLRAGSAMVPPAEAGEAAARAAEAAARLASAKCRVYAFVGALALDDGDSPSGAYLHQWERSLTAAVRPPRPAPPRPAPPPPPAPSDPRPLAQYEAFAAERERRLAVAAGPAGAAGETPRSSAMEGPGAPPRDPPLPPATARPSSCTAAAPSAHRFVYHPPPPTPAPSATFVPAAPASSSAPAAPAAGPSSSSISSPSVTSLSRHRDLEYPAAAIAGLYPCERLALAGWTLAHVQRARAHAAAGAGAGGEDAPDAGPEWPPWELPTEEQLRGALSIVEACGEYRGLLGAVLDLFRRSAGSQRYDRAALLLARRLLPAFVAHSLLPDLLRALAEKIKGMTGQYHLRDQSVALAAYVLLRYEKVEGVKAWLAAGDSAPAELKRELTSVAKQAATKPDRGQYLLELDFFPQTIASAGGPSAGLVYPGAGLVTSTVQEAAHVLCSGLAWSEGGDMVGEGVHGSVESSATLCRDNPASTPGVLLGALRQFFTAYEAASTPPERYQTVLLSALWLSAVDASCRAAGPGRALPPHATVLLGILVQPSVPWGPAALQGKPRPLELCTPGRVPGMVALLAALAARSYCRFDAALLALLPPPPPPPGQQQQQQQQQMQHEAQAQAAQAAVACLRALLTGDGAGLDPSAAYVLAQEACALRAARLAEGVSPGLVAAAASLAALAFTPAPYGGLDSPAARSAPAGAPPPAAPTAPALPVARARHVVLYAIDRCGPLAPQARILAGPSPPPPAALPPPPELLPHGDFLAMVGTPTSVPATPPVDGAPPPPPPPPVPAPSPAPTLVSAPSAKLAPAVGTMAWVRERMRAVVSAVNEWNAAARGAELKLLVLEWRDIATAASSSTSSPSSPPPPTPLIGGAAAGAGAGGEGGGEEGGASTPEGQVGDCVVREVLRRPEQAPLLDALLVRHIEGDGVGLAVRREAGRRLAGLLQRHRFDIPSLRKNRAAAVAQAQPATPGPEGETAAAAAAARRPRGAWRGWKPWVRAELYGALHLLLGRAADSWLEDRDRAALAEQLSRQLASFASQHARASAAATSAVSPGDGGGADEGAEEPGAERECLFVAQQAAALRVRLVHGLLPTLRDQRPASGSGASGGAASPFDSLAACLLRLLACPPIHADPAPPPCPSSSGAQGAQASPYPLSGPCTEALDLLHAMVCTPAAASQAQRDAEARLADVLQGVFLKMQYPPGLRARIAHVIGYTPPPSVFGRAGPQAAAATAAAAAAGAAAGPSSARGAGPAGSPPVTPGGGNAAAAAAAARAQAAAAAHQADSPASPSSGAAPTTPGGGAAAAAVARTASPLVTGAPRGGTSSGPTTPMGAAGAGGGKARGMGPLIDPWTVLEDYPETHISIAQLGAIRRRPRRPLAYVAIG
eukprot:tig00000042_g15522.t2